MYLEYIWYTLLHRTDNFNQITPKYLFEQQEVYMKINGLSSNNDSNQQDNLNSVEDFF